MVSGQKMSKTFFFESYSNDPRTFCEYINELKFFGEFSEKFRNEILIPFAQKQKLEEDKFIKLCLHDVKTLRKKDFFKIEQVPDGLASQVSLYADAQNMQTDLLEKLIPT